MSIKHLSELEWKKFSKGRDFKDAAFVRAIAALEKAGTPQHELEALDDIEKQAAALRKAVKADKELSRYLDELDTALEKQRKSSELEARKQATAQESAGDEDVAPDLLTTKLVPLLRLVRKGEEMQAMVASAGKEVAVMMSRRAISPARRKLMTDFLDAGTPKFFSGTSILEEDTVTFVLKTQAGGLAKKIRAALLKQTGLRVKVRVRGEDPDDIDDDGEEAPERESDADAYAPSSTQGVGQAPQAKPQSQPDLLQEPPARSRTLATAIVYTQARLVWVATRGKIGSELKKLETAILAAYRNHAMLPVVAQKVRKLDNVLLAFDEALGDALDAALNATDTPQKQRSHDEARELIVRYQRFLASDQLVQELDGNPFVPITVKATLTATLATLSSKIF